jgi:hypothetical protein
MFALCQLAILLAVVAQEPPHGKSGSVCVAPLPRNVREIDHDYPGGKAPREYSYAFTVQLDSRQPVEVRADAPTLIGQMPLGKPHFVIIRDAGTTIESFRFTFEKRGSSTLCLEYGPWYQTWSLEPPPARSKPCRCEANAVP